MSFFKDLKEDIVQSVNELGDSIEGKVADETVLEDDEKSLEEQVQQEMDSVLQELDAEEESEDEIEEMTDEDEEDTAEAVEEAEEDAEIEEPEEEEEVSTFEETEVVSEAIGSSDGEETVITQGTTIHGGIKSDTSLIVKGSIIGDVDCKGKLTISGKVEGNSSAAEIYVNTARLEGDLTSEGVVKIGVGTVVIGTVVCSTLAIAGAVKGKIEVDGPVVLDSTAVVQGDITAKSIQINTGAVIDGKCSMAYADIDLNSFFE